MTSLTGHDLRNNVSLCSVKLSQFFRKVYLGAFNGAPFVLLNEKGKRKSNDMQNLKPVFQQVSTKIA